MKLESGRELNDDFFVKPAEVEIAGRKGARDFYKGTDVETLDGQDFDDFWDRLVERNAPLLQPRATGGATQPDATADAAPAPEGAAASASAEEAATPAAAAGQAGPEGAADAADADEPGMTYEEACTSLRKLLNTRIVDSSVFRKTLALCTTMTEFADVEARIQEFPEFAYSDQSPYRYIKMLIDAGGLFQWDLDEDGQIIDPARYEGLTEDEVDDLVFAYGLETTEAGAAVADEQSPRKRLAETLSKFPDRAGVYEELLSYIKLNHCKYEEIQALFAGRDFSGLATLSTEQHIALQPSVFLDNMEKAGGIVWERGGWSLTPEGETFLGQLLERAAATA